MSVIMHAAETRGHANHGWLDTKHTFSFSRYYNPERMSYGTLRVLNDDIVMGGQGFGEHPHDNMEIISIPLSGSLAHADSMGSKKTIKVGEIQIMSAGTGVMHSEFNDSATEPVNFLQIWIYPKVKNIEPRYEQRYFSEQERSNTLRTIVSPNPDDDALWINQDAFLSIGDFSEHAVINYTKRNPENGVYVFVINGSVKVHDMLLQSRDGMGITGEDLLDIKISKDTTVLTIEIPMN